MNRYLMSVNSTIFVLLFTLGSFFLISCGMRTAPVFIPEKKAKQTISDLKVQQRDNRVRLSWNINHKERINRLKMLDKEIEAGDFFLIHRLITKVNCRNCEPRELPNLKVLVKEDSLIQYRNQVFFYLQFPETGLKIHSFQISHLGPDGEIFSKSKSVSLRRSNVFPKLPLPELKIVQIEDQSQILRFPFGKVVQRKKIEVLDGLKTDQLNEEEKKKKSEVTNIKIEPLAEFRLYTLRITWSRTLNHSLKVFTGKGDYFDEKKLYRNHLYRTLNREKWPETPINIKSVSDNYFLDKLKMQINDVSPPLLADTHPDILPPRISFYIDLSVKYLDTWHYNLRLVDRFGNESDASESVSFYWPKSAFFAKNYGKKNLVPHSY